MQWCAAAVHLYDDDVSRLKHADLHGHGKLVQQLLVQFTEQWSLHLWAVKGGDQR
jgi:hypothetical protein